MERKGGGERSWDRGRLCAEMQPFPVTLNIQSNLMASIFGAREFGQQSVKRLGFASGNHKV